MVTIYMLNIKGNVMYGECSSGDEYERIANDAQGRGYAISVIDEVGTDPISYACREHVTV